MLFVATANRASDIPPPLLDRLEVVQLPGYTREERVRIAAEHLLPAALREHGIPPGALRFPEATLRALAEGWTREAGVRSLSRALAAVCRHAAVRLVAGREAAVEAAAVAAAAAGGEELPGFGGGSPAPSEALDAGDERDLAASWGGGSRGLRAGGHALAGTMPAELGGWLAAEGWAAAEGPATGQAAEQELRELLAPLALAVGQAPAEACSSAGAGTEASSRRQQQQQQQQPGWRLWRPWGRPQDGEAQQLQQQPRGAAGWEAASEAGHGGRPSSALTLLGPGSMGLLAGSPQRAAQLQPPPAQQQQWGSEPAAPAAPAAAIVVDLALLEEVLGPPPFSTHDAAERVAAPGAAAGLVWTSVGGQLQYIECIRVGPGKAGQAGALTLTGEEGWGGGKREGPAAAALCSGVVALKGDGRGATRAEPCRPLPSSPPAGQLGDVLEESARIALSWVRAHADALGLAAGVAAEADIHIHLPAGGWVLLRPASCSPYAVLLYPPALGRAGWLQGKEGD